MGVGLITSHFNLVGYKQISDTSYRRWTMMSPVCNPRVWFCVSYLDPGAIRSRVLLDGYRAQVSVIPKKGNFLPRVAA